MKPLLILMLGFGMAAAIHAQPSLTVERIMQDPRKWIGAWPSSPEWSEDGQFLYFRWAPGGLFPADSLFRVAREGGDPEQVKHGAALATYPRFDGWHGRRQVYSTDWNLKAYAFEGDLYLFDRSSGTRRRLTSTSDSEQDPRFSADGNSIYFISRNNVFRLDLQAASIVQMTDLRSGKASEKPAVDAQDAFLARQQEQLIDAVRERKKRGEESRKVREAEQALLDRPKPYYYGTRSLDAIEIDPSGQFVSFTLTSGESRNKGTSVFNYVDESGYARAVPTRAKVGAPEDSVSLYVQDLERDTTYRVNLHDLPGAYDLPAYLRSDSTFEDSTKHRRKLYTYGPYWNRDGRYAVLEVRAFDNKDRWIARLDAETGRLTVLDRQHDEAWIAGPGISWFGGESTMGWLPDNRQFYFQSEKSGYSLLYSVDADTGVKQTLMDGRFEVFDPQVSRDGQWWYFTSSEESPFERHLYRMPIGGGKRERLTSLDGMNSAVVSPDEERLGVLGSYINRPPEIYLADAAPGSKASRVTTSPATGWLAYPWRDPEPVYFRASDGAQVPAQVFVPKKRNGAAVLFVHGAGYLQNVHRGWSNYYREFMFHNLLADRGYTVMNVDYRASEGYGRDWRTAIYRHMGGRDLQDYVDASQYLRRTYGISPERVFIYGGSYGGFITLMALFTEPEHFGGGAALRAVTDWAQYNHPYTANILNTPASDSVAYIRSSPIYLAAGLQDPLLICHGVVDTNVHFQDVVRLSQRLIELGKRDWQLALYPVEDHAFREPSSWRDEYERILHYIEDTVGPDRRRPTDHAR